MTNKYIKILILLLFIVSISDVITTTYIISNGGIELNPFMREVVKDPIAFLIIKMGAMTGITLGMLLVFNKPESRKMLYVAFLVPTCITLIAVFNNIYAILLYNF